MKLCGFLNGVGLLIKEELLLIESRRATSGGAWMREPAKPAPAEPGWRVDRSGFYKKKLLF
ncbi:MAG: hypothetical protein ACXWR0_07440, partial [Bdellovibrio sp.]